ncbi:MAG: glycosyltransferase [Planctomycetota bacterium]
MNGRPRVLFIARHFWPHGSIDSAGFAYRLAKSLRRDGIELEVLTPRFASSWTDRLVVNEIPIHRPAVAPRSDWSMGRYTRHLMGWLRHHGKDFDVLMVDAIREESTAAIETARSLGCSTLVRCSGWGWNSDTQWWEHHRGASRCAAYGKLADAIVAKSPQCARSLIASGYPNDRIVRIDDGFSTGATPTSVMKRAARDSLALANHDLKAEDEVPVVLCTSAMTRDGGIQSLVEAALPLVTRHPKLRIWLIGDGSYRDWIYQQLRSDGIRASIAMPGSFSDCEDLFMAADVFLQPDESGLDYFLRLAVEKELPIVTVDQPSIRNVLGGCSAQRDSHPQDDPAEFVTWISGATAKMVRQGIGHVLDDLPTARQNAGQLRKLMVRKHPHADTVQAYHDLVRRIINRSSGKSLSIGAVS